MADSFFSATLTPTLGSAQCSIAIPPGQLLRVSSISAQGCPAQVRRVAAARRRPAALLPPAGLLGRLPAAKRFAHLMHGGPATGPTRAPRFALLAPPPPALPAGAPPALPQPIRLAHKAGHARSGALQGLYHTLWWLGWHGAACLWFGWLPQLPPPLPACPHLFPCRACSDSRSGRMQS